MNEVLLQSLRIKAHIELSYNEHWLLMARFYCNREGYHKHFDDALIRAEHHAGEANKIADKILELAK